MYWELGLCFTDANGPNICQQNWRMWSHAKKTETAVCKPWGLVTEWKLVLIHPQFMLFFFIAGDKYHLFQCYLSSYGQLRCKTNTHAIFTVTTNCKVFGRLLVLSSCALTQSAMSVQHMHLFLSYSYLSYQRNVF